MKFLMILLLLIPTLATAQAHGEFGWAYQSSMEANGAMPVVVEVKYTMEHETDIRVHIALIDKYPTDDGAGGFVTRDNITAEQMDNVINRWAEDQRATLLAEVEAFEEAQAAAVEAHNEGLGCLLVPVPKPMPPTFAPPSPE